VPDRAEIGIDIRTIPGMRHGLLRDQIASYLGPEVELAPVVDVESVWTDPPWMREVFGICADVQDTAAIVEAAPYFTDASALTPALGGVPTVMSVPATRTWHTLAPEKVNATITPDQLFEAHSSVLDLVFYDADQFPSEYKGHAFVALKGSWNRSEPTGYKVVRVPFRDGRPEGDVPDKRYTRFNVRFVSVLHFRHT